jgi:hypothetical protein
LLRSLRIALPVRELPVALDFVTGLIGKLFQKCAQSLFSLFGRKTARKLFELPGVDSPTRKAPALR